MDKSFKSWTEGTSRAGSIVFGYIDGKGIFYKADSEINRFNVLKETGDVKILSYNPRPVKLRGTITGHDPDTGAPLIISEGPVND